MPNGEDVRKAREQAAAAVSGVLEQARTPLLAVLGAGDVAARSVVSLFQKMREQVAERAEAARSSVDDLPHDLDELRSRLDPAELRKLVDAYAKAATQLYEYLAERGEQTLERLRPQVERLVEQAGTVADTAQHRAEEAAGEARELADDVLGKVTRRSRPVAASTQNTAESGIEDRATPSADADTAEPAPAKVERAESAPPKAAEPAEPAGEAETGAAAANGKADKDAAEAVTKATSRKSGGRRSGAAQENGRSTS
ncbi:hypothetical protein [Streptoalloteichus hindustanus]|uniref:Heparin binding hemagglutinin HbhA n=1 Tax=Streptoalloteichus hindustanus TaxID=2017 RepID=A0A1M4U0M1_STRHI|nr:hypothetical protein [Streptoalloteichus hindustanus]SHE50312.1 heparin binding hemagglutinin HbhA [Streptoalloteichus hindustanus]